MAEWWKTAVFYQIYPRSFQDSNNDGIGDLRGIESRLDYLAALGVGALWISPFYPSPMKDFGYDVSDYCAVHPVFGSIEDFDRLLNAAKAKGIRIIIDLVLNHCSEEHPWFVEARSSRENPKHDWFIWRPIERGLFGRYKKPNNWIAQFELSSAWWPNEQTGEYYLGTFTRNQPEFNWRNGELREQLFSVMRWWLDRGVDGFRLDVVNWFLKDPQWRSNPLSLRAVPDIFQHHIHDRNQDGTHEICREMRTLANSYSGDRVLVGEIFCDDPDQAASWHGTNNDELHLAFNFDLVYQPWSAKRIRNAIVRWYAALPEGAWPNMTFSNHDQRRHATRFAGKSEEETDSRLRVAIALLLTLRGTPFIYYGEELGMRQGRIRRKDLRDPLGIKTWPIPFLGRDGARTPMQWTGEPGAGFSSARPWLPLNIDAKWRNVENQTEDRDSLLSFYRQTLALRNSSPALLLGNIVFIDGDHPDIIAYERTAENEKVLVALNFSPKKKSFLARQIQIDLSPYEVLIQKD